MKNEKVLIATRNKDKFDIVVNILNSIHRNKYEFYSLYDINNFDKDGVEKGSIEERAFNKANQYYLYKDKEDFKYIIGIDDGIKIKGELKENVKSYIKSIIEGNLLEEGEQVEIVRAYCFMKNDGSYEMAVTEIPFRYKKATGNIELKENTYPLSNVLTPIDKDEVVSEMTKEENNEYYLKFSREEIGKILNKNIENSR